MESAWRAAFTPAHRPCRDNRFLQVSYCKGGYNNEKSITASILHELLISDQSKTREESSYLCSSLLVSCCSINLTCQKKTLGAFHLQCRAQLSGAHEVILHTITWKSPPEPPEINTLISDPLNSSRSYRIQVPYRVYGSLLCAAQGSLWWGAAVFPGAWS